MKSATYSDREFQAFFTDAQEIREVMLELLGSVSGKKLLEPCAGEGAFLRGLHGKPSLVDAVDIDARHVEFLAGEFGNSINAIQMDFIDRYISGGGVSASTLQQAYDSVICNPPYGLHFSTEYRRELKRRYPDLYVRESYGLFLFFGIQALREGGRFVYIVPDSFFTSHSHRPLRKFLSDNTTLTDIIQFQSKRFETVKFGYANLCIVAGNRGPTRRSIAARWCDARQFDGSLADALTRHTEDVDQRYFNKNIDTGWTHPAVVRQVRMPASSTTLGELAECRTGIYTGNNVRFCGFDANEPPARANGHPIDWGQSVHASPLTHEQKRLGLACTCNYVPLIRGGHRQPFEQTRHAVMWSRESVSFYAENQKARLQNQSFYFRSGLAVPMVTSGRLSASMMRDAIFDQGVVGVFPNDENLIDFLLIYLNSSFATEYKSLINPGANNSANYIRRLPVPVVTEKILRDAAEIVIESKARGWDVTHKSREALVQVAIGK